MGQLVEEENKMMLQYKPKFNVNDIVIIKGSFSHNPAEEAVLIGKIKSVIIFYKKRLMIRDSKPGDIYYNISGASHLVKEDEVELYSNE